ncbi:MAG: transglycosylase SLT domain-containing protein [Acidiferrobacterales bacterium]
MKRNYVAAIALWFAVGSTFASEPTAFPHPPDLEPDIHFWKRVYTEVDTQGGLLHDARRLDVVYEVIRFPATAGNRARQRHVKQAKRHYKTILITLARGKRENLTSEEERVLGLWPGDVSNRLLHAAAFRLRFQLGQADKFRAGLVRSGAWKAHIDKTFASMGLPTELGVLPHVESSFNPAARSHVGAAGLWQFTRSTGRRYLRIDGAVDERMDPFESTIAAARLLKQNYAVTGSWPLAVTAYNHGAAGMRRAARKMGTDDIVTIVRRYQSRTFGFASRNFYVAFLAALEVETHADKHFGALERNRDAARDTEVIEIPARVSAKAMQKTLDLERQTLRRLNPALRRSVWNGSRRIPRGYKLRVPRGMGDDSTRVALANIAASEKVRIPRRETPEGVYRVRYGDSLSEIARRFGVDEQHLMDVNDISNKNRIYAGQLLRVASIAPVAGAASVKPSNRASEKTSTAPIVDQTETAKPKAAEAAIDQIEATKPKAAEAAIDQIEMAKLEAAEPATLQEAESLGGALPVGVHPALSADPGDYLVGGDGTIEVQAAETLGHYAEWLGLRASRLRQLNRMRYRQPVVIGRRLRLDFSQVKPQVFEQRRIAYHAALQEAFFQQYQITGTAVHVMRRGEVLWILAQREYDVPIWLIRQFNPDLDVELLWPGTPVTIPQLEKREEPTAPETLSPLRAT